MKNSSNSEEKLIVGSQFRRARELLQLSLEEVTQETGFSIDEIVSWEEERARPSLEQLEKMAELYGREIDYFLKETPAPPSGIEFRGKPGQSLENLSREMKIVLARFDELCRTSLEFENLLDKKREVRLPRFKESDPPEAVAKTLRRKFNIGDKPIPNLRSLLENEGIRIFELFVPEEAFSGFSFWHPEYGPCILLDANEIKGRRNFTLAHELTHLLYNQGSSLCYIPLKFGKIAKGIEYKANQVAIELLLPPSGVTEDFRKRELSKTPSENELVQMAYYRWGVSIQALGYRLENLGLIRKGYTDTLLETKPPFFRGKKGRRIGRWERLLGKQFMETSTEAYQKGLVSISKLAQTWQIPIDKALERVKKTI